ncbi:MAG: TonB-dependent receptor [Saprospiraceae bacterium]|nr:TonB-dependent receptor [Saprospiraceae bacterium]
MTITRLSFKILCFLTLGFPTASWAQFTLDSIVVTGSGMPQEMQKVGRSVTVLHPTALRSSPANSIDDILRYVPGIEVQSRGVFGAQGDISMRGSTFTQVLVMIDGMRINDPLTGHFNSNLPVTIPEIKRIEVIRGPSAAIYGADAVGGIINIVTKAFDQPSKTENLTTGNLAFGEHKLRMASLGFSKKLDDWYVTGGLQSAQSQGQLLPGRSIMNADGSLSRLEDHRNHFDITTAGLALAKRLSDRWRFAMRSSYDHRLFDARYFYTVSAFDKSEEEVANWWHQAHLDHITSKGVTSFMLSHKHTTDRFVFSPDFASTNRHTTRLTNLQIRQRHQFSERLRIVAGGQVLLRSIESTDRGDHDDAAWGVYLHGEWQPHPSWTITPSIRLDHDAGFGEELSPQISIVHDLGDWRFRGATGRAIRAPDYTERFVSFNLMNLTPGRNLGNPNLMAERSWSHELGFDWNPRREVLIRSTLFTRSSRNLIDYILTPASDIERKENLQLDASYFFASNINAVQTTGWELEGSWEQQANWGLMRANLGYTLLETSSDQNEISVYTSNHAKHLITGALGLEFGSIGLNVTGLRKVRTARQAESIGVSLSRSYTLCNAALSIETGHEKIALVINVQNLFNTEYQDILGVTIPGRWTRLGVRVQF